MTALETYQRNGFTVEIWYDEDAESPREYPAESISGLVMWGRNWNFPNDAGIDLGVELPAGGWGAVAAMLMKPYAVVDEEDGGTVLTRFATSDEASRYIVGLPDGEEEGRYAIDADEFGGPALLVLPVWVYEHSGISLSAGSRSWPFDDRWDSAQCGVAYLTAKMWGNLSRDPWTGSEEQTGKAVKALQSEVATYGQYCNGEVYGYSVRDWDGEDMDTCGGYFGYEAVEEAANEAADEAEHTPKCTGQLHRVSGRITHDADCPVHGVTLPQE